MKSWKRMAIDQLREQTEREIYQERKEENEINQGVNSNDDSDDDDDNIPAYSIKRFNRLKKEYNQYYRFKVRSKENQYLLDKFIETEFDKQTFEFIMETPRWSFITNSLNWALSWVYTKTDIMGYIGMGKMFILSTNQYKRILKLVYKDNGSSSGDSGGDKDDLLYLNTFNYNSTNNNNNNNNNNSSKNNNSNNNSSDNSLIIKLKPTILNQHNIPTYHYESLLDIGSGCGTTTLCMAPLFKYVTATEASKGMIYSLKKKGIDSVFCYDIDKCEELKDKTYDIISCLNVLDRCERPISLLNSIKKFLNQDGKLILAVVYPFKPYVEFGGVDNQPLEEIELEQETLEDYVDSFNKNVFIPNGFELDAFTVGPYISEGDSLYQNYVLRDVVFVLKDKNNNNFNNNNK